MGHAASSPAAGSSASSPAQAAQSDDMAGGCLWMRNSSSSKVEPTDAPQAECPARKYASSATEKGPVNGSANSQGRTRHASSDAGPQSPFLGKAVLPGSGSWSPVHAGPAAAESSGNAAMHSDHEWRAWMGTSEQWIKPSWWVADVVLSEAEEALIGASLAALAVGKPFQEARAAQLRRDERSRAAARKPSEAGSKEDGAATAPPATIQELDPITFLSFHFYEGLFMSVPSIRSQFRSEVAVQGKRMVDVMVSLLLRMAVAARKPDTLEYKQLRMQCKVFVARHREYGVLINQYNIVGEALLHSLTQCIGEDVFNDATRTAWLRLYSYVVQQVAFFDEEIRAEGPQEGSKKNSRSRSGGAGPAAAAGGSKSTSRTVTPKLTPSTSAATPPAPSVASGCPMQLITHAFALPPAHTGISACPHMSKQPSSPQTPQSPSSHM